MKKFILLFFIFCFLSPLYGEELLKTNTAVCNKKDEITFSFNSSMSKGFLLFSDSSGEIVFQKLGLNFNQGKGNYKIKTIIEGEPGSYKAVVLNKKGKEVSNPVYFRIAGIKKEKGCWLLDGRFPSGIMGTYSHAEKHPELFGAPERGNIGFPLFIYSSVSLSGFKGYNPLSTRIKSTSKTLAEKGIYFFVNSSDLSWGALRGDLQVDSCKDASGEVYRGCGTGGCFNSPNNRKRVEEEFEYLQKKIFPSSYFLGLFYFEFSHPYCYCKYCLKKFRDKLREKYKLIENFNKKFGTDYADFSRVEPYTPWLKKTKNYYQDWIDIYCQITNGDFQRYLKGLINKYLPGTYLFDEFGALFSFMKPSACTSTTVDEKTLVDIYDISGMEQEGSAVIPVVWVLRSLQDKDKDGIPEKPVWPDYYVYGRGPDKTPWTYPDYPKRSVLRAVDYISHGATGIIFEHAASIYAHNRENPELNEIWKLMREIHLFLDNYISLFFSAKDSFDLGVVVPYYSLKYEDNWEMRSGTNWEYLGILEGMARAHRQVRVIWDNEELENQPVKFLLIPSGRLIRPGFIGKVKNFVQRGGIVYLEGFPERISDKEKTVLEELIGAKLGKRISALKEFQNIVFLLPDNTYLRLKGENLFSLTGIKGKILGKTSTGEPVLVENNYGKGKIIFFSGWLARKDGYDSTYTWKPEKWADYDNYYNPELVKYYREYLNAFYPSKILIEGDEPWRKRVGLLRKNNLLLIGITNWGEKGKIILKINDPRNNLYDLREKRWLPVERQGNYLIYKDRIGKWSWKYFVLCKDKKDLEDLMKKPLFYLEKVSLKELKRIEYKK